MTERIQRIPQGLLAELGVVGTGRNLQEFADALVPVIDVTKYYSASRLEIVSATNNTAALGAEAQVTVPNGQYWRLVAASVSFVYGAADHQSLAISTIPPGSPDKVHLAQMQQAPAGAACVGFCVIDDEPDFLFGPGTAIIGELRCAAAVAANLYLAVGFVRLS